MRHLLAFVPLAALCACQLDPAGPPALEAGAALQTTHAFRGQPRNTEGVIRSEVTSTLPLTEVESVGFSTLAFWNLSNDTGDGAFPDGNGGQVSELDLRVEYAKQFESFQLAYGVIAYEFPNFVAPSTHEAFLSVARPWRGLTPTVTLYADFDEVQGFYVENSLSGGWDMDERTAFDWTATLGLTDSDHARAYYGENDFGLSDVRIDIGASRQMNEHTTASVSAHVSSALGKFSSSLEDAGLESRNAWLALGVHWTF